MKLFSSPMPSSFPLNGKNHSPLQLSKLWASVFPVIGTSFGSLPELIPDFAGIICQSEREFCEVVANKPNEFNPNKIISYARETFNSRITAEKLPGCLSKGAKWRDIK